MRPSSPARSSLRQAAARCALVCAALLLAGCQGDVAKTLGLQQEPDEDEISLEPIVMPRGKDAIKQIPFLRDRRPVDDEDEAWKAKYDLAQDYSAGGYDAEALQIVQAALSLDPPSPWAGRFTTLESSLRVLRMEDELLRAEAWPLKDYVVFGEPVDLEIRLRNVGREPLSLLPPQRGARADDVLSPGAVSLEVKRVDRDIYASRMERSWTQNFLWQRPEDGATKIAPGAVHRVPVRIPADEVGPALVGLRTIEVAGMLRPARVEVQGQARPLRLRIRPGRVVVLPKSYEPLVQDPLGTLRQAIDGVAPVHLLVASEFVPRARAPEGMGLLARALTEGDPSLRRAALGALERMRERFAGKPLQPLAEPLVERLGTWPARDPALMEGLAAFSGRALAADVRLWRDWWARDVDATTLVTAPRSADR
ncbi:MAG: hypothetical protein H6806_06995 [Planctomycetes bacterium]|nr:hypothetical protein [Planctomycetota bacterium]MCB9825482.1 hypothetical protein [Planctomycetota bacterium]MCB9829490.1 hypothetical protein [Planctomycetota bacterium]MCB9900576.1 hypothetical protein [Planctomycetota bacterium]